MSGARQLPCIGFVWAQFSAYHVDRIEAAARQLTGRARVLAVEVCSRSEAYAWAPSGLVGGADKRRLFPDQAFEEVHPLRRWWAQLRALRGCSVVFIGLGYNEPDALLLCWTLRLLGVKVVMMTASKWDDRPRRTGFELMKACLLSAFSAALVGGARQKAYVEFLGFRRRPVLVGYNTVNTARIRAQAAAVDQSAPNFAQRRFIFVGRFVAKKQLELMLRAYAAYAVDAGASAHGFTLIGAGECEGDLRRLASELAICHLLEWTGFLDAAAISARLARGLALVLVSREEQWGLVINEAVAVGLPVIASAGVGAREALVGNLETGCVAVPGSVAGIAAALATVGASEVSWTQMLRASAARTWFADSERFAEAADLLVMTDPSPVTVANHARFTAGLLPPLSGAPD